MTKIFSILLLLSLESLCQDQTRVISFTLINAETNVPIRTLTDKSVINLSVDGYKLNIRANITPQQETTITSQQETSVSFSLFGKQSYFSIDRNSPYSLFGDVNGNYSEWTPLLGDYTLEAQANKNGPPLTISFLVTRDKQPWPTLIISSPLAAFGNVCINTTPEPNSFTISGTNLTSANVTVAANTGYTYSTTASGPYSASLSLSQPGGTYFKQIFVKFNPTVVQNYNGNIAVAGGGAIAPINVAASGAGVNSMAMVTTGDANAISQTTATCAGTITAIGCTAVTAYGIEYSTTNGFQNGTGISIASENHSGSNFSTALIGLASNTTYYYHAFVSNAGGTAYGTQRSFTTSPPPPSTVGGYFASPNGTGNGTYASPFKIANFWAVAIPGDTLNLMDGHYTGANSMITPPQNLSGTATNRIVIRALNDGMVDIDGQGQNAPVSLSYNNFFTMQGFNAHNAGSPMSINVSVVSLSYSSYNILRRICAWEAADGNTNVFGIHHGDYNLLEDCAGWGMARKTFSNSQQGNYTTFRRCFGRWEGSHAEGPKKTFGVSYNSYNALLENCIATWDGLRMQENYELHDYNGNGVGQFFNNYEVQQPDGMYSHDGFDVLPDVANARLYGCIAYLKANQRYHNSFKKWAAPFAFEIKGIDIKDALSYIQPGSHTDIWNVNLASIGNATTNSVKYLIQIGGELGHISSDWNQQNNIASTTCNGMNTGTIITKRYVDGVKTNENLWPWPMNQRIIDAMTQGGYAPINVTQEVFGLCGNTPPPQGNIVTIARQWLSSNGTMRDSLGVILDAWQGNIDSVIQLVKPIPTSTQTGEVFYQNFTNPVFQQKYPNHQFHMYVPTHYNSSTPIGVMLWLHGGGSWDATEIDHLAQFDMDNEHVTGRSYPRTETDASNFILVAPIAPFGTVIPHPLHASRWNVPNADQYLIDIITELSTRYNIDYNRIVIAGYSMGGIGAYHMALRLNDRLAAVMASAGSWKLGTWDGLKNMPMYIIQGVNDAHYNNNGCRAHFTPIENARLAHNLLHQSSNIHGLYEYPGEHPWDESGYLYWHNFINGQQGWVTDKVRDPYRNNITAVNPWRSYDVGSNFNVTWTENPSPHTMWVSINQIGPGTITYDYARVEGTGGCSSLADFNNWAMYQDTMNMTGGKVEANITGQNQIVVISNNVTNLSLWLHPNMVNFNNPVQVTVNGVTSSYILRASLLAALKSYERRWDWSMIYHAEIVVSQ